MAQRVVRRVGRAPRVGRGDPLHRRVDRLHQQPQELGLPAGPAALDPPDRRRQLRPRGGRGELRRHHLRQGRVARCGSWSPGSARRSSSPACARTSPSTRSATPSSPTCSARWRRRPGATSARLGRRSGCRPPASTRCAPTFEVDADGRVHLLRGRADRAPATSRRCGATGSAIGLYDQRRGPAGRADARRDRRRGRAAPRSPSCVGQRQPDLVLLNDDDLTYAKIRLDERSLATVVARIDTLDDSLPRALCWGAAWDMTRDAEMSDHATSSTLVLRGRRHRDRPDRGRRAAAQGQERGRPLLRPRRRAPRSGRRWEHGLRELLEDAEPGSDHQLALARAYGAAATQRGPRLRRRACRRLGDARRPERRHRPALGAADSRWPAGRRRRATRSHAELERDTHHLRPGDAAAAPHGDPPTAEAKEEAWNDAVVRDDVPTRRSAASRCRSRWPARTTLLEPYVDRYLDIAATIWEDKGVQRATGRRWIYLFPRAHPGAGDARQGRRLAGATSDANPAAKRYVREGCADLERALAAQARDAGITG